MAVYFVGFALSLGLVAYSEKKSSRVFFSFSFVALLILCLIAGLRAQTVGTDVRIYAKPLTEAAIVADDLKSYFNIYWFDEWRNMYVKDYEIGFSLVVYLVAKLTRSLGTVLFVVQALTVVPIYVAMARNRKNSPVWLGLFLYCFLFFNSSLNLMRQWIAMAFLLLAMQMLLEKKGGLVCLFTVCGCLFHYSAVIVIPIYAVYWFVWLPRRTRLEHENFRVRGATLTVLLFFLIAIVAVLNLQLLSKLLSLIGLDRFSGYLKGDQFHLLVNQVILRLPLLVILLLGWKEMYHKHPATPFFLAMLLMDFLTAQLGSVDVSALRIANYFGLYVLLWVPSLCGSLRPGVKRGTVYGLLCCYALFYWYYTYVYTMRAETYPYAFAPLF